MLIPVAHVSLQYKDTPKQHHEDILDIFHRAKEQEYAWITGTEAGPGSNNTGEQLIKIGRLAGYKVWVPEIQGKGQARNTDCWIAVNREYITGNFRSGFRPAIPSSSELYRKAGHPDAKFPRWGTKGLVTVSFDSLPKIGEVNIGAGHFLTDTHDPDHSTDHDVNRWDLNEHFAEVIGDWAKEVASGPALAFYAGDQNMKDSANNTPQGDTFFGEKMTSLADELEKWQNTIPGRAIDVIATYDKDRRVRAVRFRVLDDSEFPQHHDHFLLEGVIDIDELKVA